MLVKLELITPGLSPSLTFMAPVVYAATDGCGLYKLDSGTWTRMGANTDMFATEDFLYSYGQVVVPGGLGNVVYAFDRKTGELWRSENGGANWGGRPIYTVPPGEPPA